MIYVLLIVPHLLALGGLLAFACRSMMAEAGEDDYGWGEDNQDDQPPLAPEPLAPLTGPPLPHASSPRRRMRVGERLSELHSRRPRREHDPPQPTRPPVKT
jgi:hypothetical protein